MVGWFRRLHPPPSGLGPCPSSACFSFPLPCQGCPVWARCVGGLSLPSSFAFPSSCSGWVTLMSFSTPFHVHFLSFHFHFHLIAGTLTVPPCCGKVCVCVNHLKRCKTSITVVPFHLVSYIKYLEQGGNPVSIAGSRMKRAMQRLIRSLINPMYLRLFSNLVSFHCNGAGLSREPLVLFCTVVAIWRSHDRQLSFTLLRGRDGSASNSP